MDILQLKNTIKLNNSVDEFNRRTERTVERISDLEGRTNRNYNLNYIEKIDWKKMTRASGNLWDYKRRANICVI